MSRKNKNKRFRGVGDDEILRAWNEARAADALVKKADIQEDDQKEEIKEISSPIVYLQEVVENMMGDDKETETSEEIKAKQIKEKAEAKKIGKEEKAKLLVERSQRIGGQNGKKNYADDDVNWVIRYQLSRSQISENVMIIDVANSVNQELITASLLEFAASDPAQYKQAVFPLIIGRGHFAGLHIKRNEDGAFSVSYIDPMGDLNPQVAEDAIDGFIKSAAGVIGNVADKVGNVADKVGLGWLLGKKSDDILEDLKSLPSTPSIRGANLVHSSISNDIVNSLNTALGVNPGSIQVSRNRLQSSISVPNRFTNIPESRETTNNHCGPILAELLVELANENIVVSKNRLRDANGNDLKDLSREISDRMGSRLREEHLTSLREDNPNLDRALANRDAYVNSSNDFQGYATAFLAARALAGQYGPDLGNLLASSDSSGFNMNEYSGPQSSSGQQLQIGNIHSYSSSLSANHYAGLYNNFSPSMVPSSWNDLSSSYAILPPPPPNYTSDQVQSSNDTQRNLEKKDFSDVFLTTNQIPSALHPNLAIHTNASPRPPQVTPTTSPPTNNPNKNPTQNPTANPTANPTQNSTANPTENPTENPTQNQTGQPSENPTGQPSSDPTSQQTSQPTGETTVQLSDQPTSLPSADPSSQTTSDPTSQQTSQPTGETTVQLSDQPTSLPSELTEKVAVVSSSSKSVETVPGYVMPVSVAVAGSVTLGAASYAGYVYMTSIALAPFMALALHEGHIDEELMNLITQLRSGENLDHLKDNLNKALMAILPSDISDTERTSYAQQVTTTLSYLGVEENYNDLVASFAGLRSYIAAMKDHGHPINTHRTIKSILSSWLNLINLPSNSTEYAVLNKALERMREYEASEEVSLVPLLALSIGGVELGEELQQARVELSLSQSFEIEKVRRALKLAAKELVAAEDPEIDEAINDLVPNRFGSDEFYEYAYEAKDIDALSVAQNNLEQNGHRETEDELRKTELSGIIFTYNGTLLRDDRGYAIVEMPACDFANGGDMKAEFSKQLLHIARTRDNGENIYPVKILMPYRREGSNWKLGEIRITKKDLDNGEVRYGFVGTVHNPCSRQQLEQQLESLDQEVQDIIAECIYENPANGHNKGNTRHVLNRISSQNSFPVSFDARESGVCVSYAMRNLKHRSDPWAEMLNSDFRHLREDDVRLIASSNSDELNSFARPAIVGENAANLLNKRRIGLGGNGLDRDNIEDLKGAIAQVLESEAVRARGVRAEVRLNRDGAAIKMMLKAELRANEADLEKSEIFDGPDFPGQDSFPLGQTLGNEIANKRLLRNNWVQIPNLTNSDLIGLGEREEDDMKSDHPNKGGADDSGSYDDFLMREFSKRIESGNTSRLPKSINSDLIGLGEREDDDMKSDHSNKGGSEEYSYFDYSDKRSIETNLDDEYSSSDDSDEDYGATIRTTSGEIFKTGSINSSRHEVEAKRDDSNSSLGFNSLAGNEDTTGHPNLHESSLNLSEISTSDSTRLDSTRLYDLLSNADEVDQVLNETTKTTDYSKPVEIATKPILPSKKSEEQTKKVEKRGEIVAAKPTKQNKEDEIARLRGIIATKKDTLAESEKKLKNIENKWGQRGRHILDLMNNLIPNKRSATYTRLTATADLNELYNEALSELKLGKSVINHEAGGAKMTEEELSKRFGEYENILKEKQKCEKNVKEISDTLNFYERKLDKALEDKNNTGLDDKGYLKSYLSAVQRKDTSVRRPPIPPISTASSPSHYPSANTRRLEQLSPENFLEKLEKDANFMQESLNSGENHEVILNVLSREDNDVAPETTPEIPSREDNDVAPKSAPKILTANAESLVSGGKAGGNARGGNGGRGKK